MSNWDEAYNETYQNRTILLYQDSISVPVLCSLFMACYTCYIAVLAVCICCRRTHHQIRVRNCNIMLLNVLAFWYTMLVPCLRLAIGRWRYPCLLYSIHFSLIVPLVFVPALSRLWKLFFTHKLWNLQSQVVEHRKQSFLHHSPNAGANDVFKTMFEERNKSYNAWQKLYTFLISQKFVILLYSLGIATSIPIWLLSVFIGKMDAFGTFTNGCGVTFYAAIVFACQVFVYLFFIVLLVGWLFFYRMKDQLNLRLENILVVTVHISTLIVYGIFSALYYDVKFFQDVERFLPSGMIFFVPCVLDTFITCLVPILKTFYKVQKRHSNVDLNKVLEKPPLRFLFIKFLMQSFCVESMLCVEDIESYKSLGDDNRKWFARYIYDRYLQHDSEVTLNIPLNGPIVANIDNAMQNLTTYPVTLFDELYDHCRVDLMEPYTRFLLSNIYHKNAKLFDVS